MHRALIISEILNEIIAYFPGSDKALVALAATCRTFQDPALAVRWKRLYDFKSLIPLFPSDLWRELHPFNIEESDPSFYEFRRLPLNEDWIHFEQYTSRVRQIEIHCEAFEGMVRFMTTLSMRYLYNPSHAQRHLFPNLRELVWHSQDITELPFVTLFFPPSLRSLALQFDDDDERAPSLLLLLESQCLALTPLRMYGCLGSDSVFSRALESRSCRQLESLDCGEIDELALWHLSQLPTLKDLSVRLPDLISTHMVCGDWFVKLQTLSLTADDMTPIISFLQLAPLSLKGIKIHVMVAGVSPSLSPSQVLSTISSRLCHKVLTNIRIRVALCQPRFEITLDITALRPLCLFSKLRSIHIDRFCSFELNDDDLTELATAWPLLEELTLGPNRGWQRTSGITFKGLATLLRACPLLHTLALVIDATRLCDISLTGSEVLNDRIETLLLGDSIIERPAAVALILDDLFWSLKHVDAWLMTDRADEKLRYTPLWDEVNSHLLIGQSRKTHRTTVRR
ncbi:hypothetical protein BJ138DRAFT_1111102 [Hygrophoropsis aurantiaca]|uniref:Uncharacterized protein n=1 Tax=Hygrophoropsis aurantiaca TaxID=72124 RepID=A0ACB8AK67_9AGAM|nr:hypothetical protein BJ138DRAFT_1111102 [Hygrophoropsis aurantiaca]